MPGDILDQAAALGLYDADWCNARGMGMGDVLGAHDCPPSPNFDPVAYQQAYPDTRAYPHHPLVHYINFGQFEGRFCFPVFPQPQAQVPPARVWVENNEFSLTGAPLAALELCAGLGFAQGQVMAAAPCAGPLQQRWGRALCHGLAAIRAQTPAVLNDLVAGYQTLFGAYGIQLLHAHTCRAYPAVLAAHGMGVPTIWTIHEPDPSEHIADMPPDIQAQLKTALRVADRLVFVSRPSMVAWQGFAGFENAALIPKALPPRPAMNRDDARTRLGFAPDHNVILSVGTVCPRKGQADLVAALARFQHAPATSLVMIGFDNSAYAQRMRAQAAGLKLPTRLINASASPQDQELVQDYFAAADIFVMSSYAESHPRTLAEAQMATCPVIATDVPGIADMVHDGAGVLYAPGDVATLGHNIASLLANAPKRAQMRNRLRNAPGQDYAAMIDAHKKLIASVRR